MGCEVCARCLDGFWMWMGMSTVNAMVLDASVNCLPLPFILIFILGGHYTDWISPNEFNMIGRERWGVEVL